MGSKVAQVAKAPTPLAVERLKLQSKECLQQIQQQQLEEQKQNSDNLRKVTVQLPRTEFHVEKPEPRSVVQGGCLVPVPVGTIVVHGTTKNQFN